MPGQDPNTVLQGLLNSYEKPQPFDTGKTLEGLLTESTPVERPKTGGFIPDDAQKWNRLQMGSLFAKSVGLSVVKGLLNLPSGLGDYLWKRGIDLPFLPPSQLMAAATPMYQKVDKTLQGVHEQIKQGMIGPKADQVLRMTGGLHSPAASFAGLNYFTQKMMRNVPDIVATAPEMVGETVGSLPANAALYGGFGTLAEVAGAKTVMDRTARHLGASTAATMAQSYLIQLRDGESSWMQVVRDLGVNAAFEALGMHGLHQSWRNELGGEAQTLAKDVAKRLGTTAEATELKLTQVRGGAGGHDIKAAESVVQAGKENPALRDTPIDFQARKSVAEYWSNVVPNRVTVDKTLPPDFGVEFDVLVDGKPVAEKFRISSSKEDPNKFTRMTDAVAQRVVDLTQQGKVVTFANVRVANGGAWGRMVRRLRGENAGYGKMDARKLTEFEEKLGAAPRGSLAEVGTVPEAGTKVQVSEPGKPSRVAIVVGEEPSTAAATAQGPYDLTTGQPFPERYGPPTTSTPTPAAPAAGTGTVQVRDPVSGKVSTVSKNHTRVWLFAKKEPVRFSAHSDGSPRAFQVELNSREALMEPVDAGPHENYFQSQEFGTVDRDGDLSNGPRGFIHPDGSITLSLTKGARLMTYLDGDPQPEMGHGPLDTIRAMVRQPTTPEKPYMTPAERYAYMGRIGATAEERPRSPRPGGGVIIDASKARQKPFGAGFVPRSMRTEGTQTVPGGGGDFVRTETPLHPRERLDASRLTAEAEEAEISAAKKTPTKLTTPPPDYLAEEWERLAQGEAGPTYSIDQHPLITDPALMDAQKAAKILMETKNADPSTPVRVLVSDSVHSAEHPAEFTWTLGDLAEAEPGLFSFPQLRSAAVSRGYRAMPHGEGAILKDGVTGAERIFETRLEAANFLGKLEMHELGPKLEDEAEAVMKLGWRRGFDADLDGGDFQPREAQSIALNTLVDNNRAGVKIWTASEDLQQSLQDRATAARKVAVQGDPELLAKAKLKSTPPEERAALLRQNAEKKAAALKLSEQLEAEVKGQSGLGLAVRELGKKLGLPDGTLRVMDLGRTQGGKKSTVVVGKKRVQVAEGQKVQMVGGEPVVTGKATEAVPGVVVGGKAQALIYNHLKVTELLTRYGEDLQRLLRVNPGNVETALQQLSRLDGGLDILSHPDTESAILYAYFKNTQQAELMKAGQVIQDAATQRPYRVYDAPTRHAFLKNSREQLPGPKAPDTMILDPHDTQKSVELADVVQTPPEHDLGGVDGNAPPPVMEAVPEGPEDAPLKAKWSETVGMWVKTREVLYRKLERETGIPFFRTYMDVEQSRNAMHNELAPMQNVLHDLYRRVTKRADRTDVQLLMEEMITGNKAGATSMAAKMQPDHVKVAEELAEHWRQYMGKIGFTPEDVTAGFKDVAALRKKGGDFYAYMGSKPALPKVMAFLKRQMIQAQSPLHLDERETDFYRLGMRLARMLAYEKHLTPAINGASDRMKKAGTAVQIPQDIMDNFHNYLGEVMHTPDNIQVTAARTIKLAMEKGAAIAAKMTGGRVGKDWALQHHEAVDIIGSITSLGYAANLTWNPSSVIQQYMQTMQTTLPELGWNYTLKGLKQAAKWMRDKDLQAEMAQRGIAGRTTLAQPLSVMDEMLQQKGKIGIGSSLVMDKFMKWGTHTFQVGDDMNRVIAYTGKREAMREHMPDYVAGKISWQKFREETRLDLQDHAQGPLTQMIKEHIDSGQLETAAHLASDHFQNHTQFSYNRGNGPQVLDGSLGRLLGQYGTWPMAYGNYLGQLALGGEKKLTRNKINALASIVAVQAGMNVAMTTLFDADASKWGVWQSFRYRGGPYMELAEELRYLAGAQPNDPVRPIFAARVARQILGQTIPGMAGLTKMGRASVSAYQGEWQRAARELMGLPQLTGGPVTY